MSLKSLKARYLVSPAVSGLAMLAAIAPGRQLAQETGGTDARNAFVGTWKATCQDGNPRAVRRQSYSGKGGRADRHDQDWQYGWG